MRIRHRIGACATLRHPLVRTGRALGQFPFVAEQVPEEVAAPLRGRRGPGDFQAAGDRVTAFAGAKAALPAQALLLDAGRFGLRSHLFRIAGAVGLAEGVAARDEGHRLLVVHRHAGEGLADIPRRRDRVRVAVRAFRVDVDQAHLHGRERIFEIPVAGVALVFQPLALGAPVDVLFRFPDVLTPAAETEGLEAHRFQGDVAGEDHQVGPGNLPAVLLLDRPEQPARLVEVRIVGPAVEGRKALAAVARAAAAVAGAVGAGAVPRHADEQRSVVAEVRRPPVLRLRHQFTEVLLHGLQVETLELFGVVEILAHRIGLGGMLVQDIELQLVRPPVPVRRAAAGRMSVTLACHRALAIFIHSIYSFSPEQSLFRLSLPISCQRWRLLRIGAAASLSCGSYRPSRSPAPGPGPSQSRPPTPATWGSAGDRTRRCRSHSPSHTRCTRSGGDDPGWRHSGALEERLDLPNQALGLEGREGTVDRVARDARHAPAHRLENRLRIRVRRDWPPTPGRSPSADG